MQKFRDAVLATTDRPAGALRPVSGATVTVLNLDGTTPTLYSDNGTTALASNVVTTDSSGEYSFYAANGRYRLTITSSTVGSESVSDIVLFDPEDADFKRVTPQDYMTAAQKADVASFTGSLDVTAALQAALDAVHTAGKGEVFLPPGRYRKADTASSQLVMYSNTTIRGCGDSSIIFFDDRDTVARSGNDLLVANNADNIAFLDFKIEGTNATYTNETNQKQCLTGGTIDGLRMQGVTIERVRYMATAFNNVKRVRCIGNSLDYCPRDGLRFTNSDDVVVANNILRRVTDDCIALHALDASTVPSGGHVVIGNVMEQCQGMKILGAKQLIVRDNIIRRPLRSPILVELAASGSEGDTPQFAIDISGNNITDVFASRGTNYAIRVASAQARALGGLTQQAGVSVATYPYNYLNNIDSGSPVKVGTWGVRIANNTIARTRDVAAAYSDWGYGSMWDRITANFVSDPAITSADFQAHGIQVVAPMLALQIRGNQISGTGTGFQAINLTITGSSNVMDYADVDISGNSFFDCPGIGVGCSVLGSGTGAKQIVIRDNLFDLDPFFRAATHNADNTWSSTGSVLGISVSNTIGWLAGGNVFKHCGQTGIVGSTTTESSPNIVYADFVGPGDNASNKGVRQIPSASVNIVVPIDGDPTSATYGQIANAINTRAASIPTAGRYIAGHRVAKDTPTVAGAAGSQYTVTGWWRLTTGNAHVLNTDWVELRQLTGT